MNKVLVPDTFLSNKELQSYESCPNIFNNWKCPNLEIIFLHDDNRKYTIKNMYQLHKKFGGTKPIDVFNNLVPIQMNKWISTNNLNEYFSNPRDWTLELNFINRDFIKTHYNIFKDTCNNDITQIDTDINPFKHEEFFLDDGVKTLKKYDEMTFENMRNINLWSPHEVNMYNGQFKNKNTIPVWQRSMSKRPYDRDIEGLRDNVDNSSLETPIYKYDMSDLY